MLRLNHGFCLSIKITLEKIHTNYIYFIVSSYAHQDNCMGLEDPWMPSTRIVNRTWW